MIQDKIRQSRILPVIALDNVEDAIPLCNALRRGGLLAAEITFRTKAAREAIRVVSAEFPDFLVGAGTVTRIEEVEAAKQAGAQFAVAPGCNPKILAHARKVGLPFFPGVMTPSDIEAALDEECVLLKFFPAGEAGGAKMIQALNAPYQHRGINFIPTGGVTADNMMEYFALKCVAAVGGTWMVKKDLITAKNWDAITTLTKTAMDKIAAAPK
ncbi:MAG: bifunctional 4-hydroxy-2-oxoglutarate aldolase/2-dehydro-3-deoxy-phosphogluconate aldolase [Candidatus Sumerlaeota bacterium]|nr:bifunctional 4-hydroxy-2-oxoglutarate aldolase/2-dehydro-3-deoxy-phosphogluconate aldolase [Candidatus Sumerlaeota bacterium]